jgi:hypothetical protein
LCDGSKIYLHTDLLGLESIAYFENSELFVVSNRVHAITHCLESMGVRRQPNLPAILGQLASHHAFFQQPFCDETSVKGLFIVPVDEFVEIDGHVLRKRKKTAYSGLHDGACLTERDYRDLIDAGAAEMVRNIGAVLSSGKFTHVHADISGGKDSRTVLAAILKAGHIRDVKLTTYETAEPADFTTGLRLAQMFGAAFYDGDERTRYSKSPKFALNVWRSVRGHLYHRIGIASWFAFRSNDRTLHMVGGCGEVYRDMWFEDARQWLGTDDMPDQQRLRGLFHRYCQYSRLPPDALEIGYLGFAEAIGRVPGKTVGERLSSHYRYFRNRYHFGNGAYNAYSDALDWSPYQSIFLLRAALGLPFDQRVKRTVSLDVIDALVPLLNFVDFADGPWPEDLRRRSREHPALEGLQLAWNEQRAREEWGLAEARRRAALDSGVQVVDPPMRAHDLRDLIASEAHACLLAMRELDADLAAAFTSEFEVSLLAEREMPRLGTMHLSSKLLSIYDLCFDRDTSSLRTDSLPFGEAYAPGLEGLAVL